MRFDPITQPTLADQAHQRIIDALLDGRFEAGDRLVMDRLAEQLGVSRTPIRDALARLERDGLVRTAARGYVVREVTDDDVAAIYQARSAVEGHAARLVAAGDPRVLVPVETVLADIAHRDVSRPADAFWANRDLHRAIVAATGNSLLVDCFDSIWSTSVAAYAYGRFHRMATEHADIAAEHTELVKALGSADPVAAETAMLQHLDAGRNRRGY